MFRCWPNSDVKVLKRIAVVCRSDRTIRRSAVQSFAGVWPFPSRLQRGVHSARPEKVDSWLHRCWLVPTHFQPVSAFKAAGTPRGPSTNGLPDVRRSSSAITVRLPAGSFYWICRAMHPIWNSPRGRPWWLCRSPSGPVGGLWHGRAQHPLYSVSRRVSDRWVADVVLGWFWS